MKKTTTIRIDMDIKKELDTIKGTATHSKIVKHLIDFFLTKK